MWFVISALCLIVGIVAGWMASERYTAFMTFVEHDYEELFKENPHPEIYDDEGEINRGTYLAINFDPDFDPDLDGWTIERDD